MKIEGQDILLSASDLMRFMGCNHATAMDLRYIRGEPLVPAEDSEDAKILQKQGDDHELRFLSRLKAERHSVIEFSRQENLGAAARATREALVQGAEVLFQGAFLSPPWGGWSDFLIRTEKPSTLGGFSYEVVDTKLKRKPDPKHILQLVLYSDLLANIQGCEPDQAHIELGNGARFSFRLPEYAAYARHARARLEHFVAHPTSTFPEPVRMCGLCRWREDCDKKWESTDSLALVAAISRSQRHKLLASGVTTMTELGRRSKRVPRLAEATLRKLALQARLQSARRAGGPPTFELKLTAPDRGLALLPKPDPADLFYDIEGDPFYEGGLEYLHGIWFSSSGHSRFEDFWAHNRAEEGEALRRLMAFFENRLKEFPKAHIYHYAAYEISALRRLTSSHGIGEALLDQMLRENRFVDLYTVVSGALIASEPNYSLKSLEAFYMEERTGEVKTAGGSVVAYEHWRETGDPKLLEEIRDYNQVDCISTQKLRDWLVSSVRPPSMPWRPIGAKSNPGNFDLVVVDQEQAAADALREELKVVAGRCGDRVAGLLFDLVHFHDRERKPAWWSIFDKIGKEPEELVDDLECLGDLTAKSRAVETGRSWERTYEFPEQETKIEPGSCHVEWNGLPAPVTAMEIDQGRRTARVKFPKTRFAAAPDQTSILPGPPLNTDAIETAIERVVTSFIRDDGRYPAILDFILKKKPRSSNGGSQSALIDPAMPLVPQIVGAIDGLKSTVLPIRGPPGTGKTYVSSCAILALVKKGKRVAVASNSHKAVDNLLYAILDRAGEAGVDITVAKKGGDEVADAYSDRMYQTESNDDEILFEASVVGGTAWLFSRAGFDASFDYLFVDEAGQVSVANVVAMATCAKNIVLVGDPMQLAQPLQGVHPGESGLSALEYLLAGHNTVPPDRGIFLPVSRRMHPDVCRFVSDIVYEGRLTSDKGAANQRILDYSNLSGVRLIEVPHVGNSQSSTEEVAAINEEINRLVGARFRDRDGIERSLDLADILVVAPYNLQVNLLKSGLPAGARVGTVDKFQGQEAPICLVSMTTSSGDDLPRGVDFLFSLHRINVAISRAQVLALVFASPRLLEVACTTVDDMRLVNSLCALREYGRQIVAS
ncbi:TM0106 family RecB-like putative nuclease [Bradyrhizobium sp. UFLA01-814]|uniref:TM0106 family RecB-like putative nuclease n=1 Tax=Bradyrhizobium sp. UFLA01-814 TaxID=3023480 RepID=UPI00398B1BA2